MSQEKVHYFPIGLKVVTLHKPERSMYSAL